MPQFSIYSWFGFSIPLVKRFRLIRDAGFTQVFIWWGDEFKELNGAKEAHPDWARAAGLEVENVHLPYYRADALWSDSLDGEELIRQYEEGIRGCAAHQIPTAVLHPTSGDNPPPPTLQGLDRVRRLLDLAETQNVNLAFENVNHPEYLDYILSAISHPRLGFCYDSGHDYLHAGIDGALLTRYGNRLMALHLHDNDGTGDRHWIPGEGRIDWQLILQQLEKVKYEGALSLEVTNEFSKERGRESAEQFLSRAYAALQKITGNIK